MGFPLATAADQILAALAAATGSSLISKLDGTTLLCERAVLGSLTIPGRISAGGGCRLFDAIDDTVALNLSRPTDRELLWALFETNRLNIQEDAEIAAHIARSEAGPLVARGRALGLAIAREREALRAAGPPIVPERNLAATAPIAPERNLAATLVAGPTAPTSRSGPPRVVDLSALWAGPLAAHLLWLAGAEVTKVESRTRPDSMRDGDSAFFSLLNQGKSQLALDFKDPNDRAALVELITSSDIVIEASRPRALAQLGIDAPELVRSTPGLVWVSITAHGSLGEAASWVGFGDDCGVAGGLTAALRDVTGVTGFVGDAIGDPLTGMSAALSAWEAWKAGRGGRYGLAMSQVVAHCLSMARNLSSAGLESSLMEWQAAVGKPFPTIKPRTVQTHNRPPFTLSV